MNPDIRLAVVQDNHAFRKRLVETLNAHKGWRVVVKCGSVATAFREIPGTRPDLVLLVFRLSLAASRPKILTSDPRRR